MHIQVLLLCSACSLRITLRNTVVRCKTRDLRDALLQALERTYASISCALRWISESKRRRWHPVAYWPGWSLSNWGWSCQGRSGFSSATKMNRSSCRSLFFPKTPLDMFLLRSHALPLPLAAYLTISSVLSDIFISACLPISPPRFQTSRTRNRLYLSASRLDASAA